MSRMRSASSTAVSVEVSTQPRVATRPFFASMPTAMQPGKALHASRTRSGFSAAAVPMMQRFTPAFTRSSMSCIVRSPPPSSTWPSKAATTSRISGRWAVLPSKAAVRSTRCSHSAPFARHLADISTGSPYTVTSSRLPWRRRTALPSSMSMAG